MHNFYSQSGVRWAELVPPRKLIKLTIGPLPVVVGPSPPDHLCEGKWSVIKYSFVKQKIIRKIEPVL
ncbi:hypothetical protein DPMN_002250 [Dreissena polymorpha]|uniref:Uncharacterized protein n=1 Tax=Dreissena polymorpha TaxID=45954 RepID=A0A9D4MLA7_DREPO|nr:hypothetical protein DPMN_002250 [Dreissena polymorpha]